MSSARGGPHRLASWPSECREIVFVANRYPDLSGGTTALDNLANALTERGVRVRMVSLWPPSTGRHSPDEVVFTRESLHRGPLVRGDHGWAQKLLGALRLPFKLVDRRLANRRLRRIVTTRDSSSAVVFTHVLAKRALDATGWSRNPRGPLLIGQHHSQFASLDHETWLRDAMQAHFADVDAFVALTAEDAEQFQTFLAPPCVGIPNPIDPSPTGPRAARENLVVALARLEPEKQLDAMIRIFARATSDVELSGWRLEIYGEGSEHADLERLIGQSPACDRIRLMGVTADPRSVLATASVNLLTSRYEGFGMSLLEAATQAVPSIAYDCSPGVRAVIGDGCGILIAPGDEAAYAAELSSLLRDPDALSKLAARAQVRSEHFAPDHIIQQWAHLLQSCYAHRGASGAP